MATMTFAAKIAQRLRLLRGEQQAIDDSTPRLPDPDSDSAPLTENTDHTTAIAAQAAAEVEAELGSVGSFDDTDHTVGDLVALSYGVKFAVRIGKEIGFNITPDGLGYMDKLDQRLQREAQRREDEAADPYVPEVESTSSSTDGLPI